MLECNDFNYCLSDFLKFDEVWVNTDIVGSTAKANFIAEYSAADNDFKLTEVTPKIGLIYSLLSAKYGNSHIATTNKDKFKQKVFMTIYQYAPNWIKELAIQESLRSKTEAELMTGAVQKTTHGYNPSTDITGNTDTEISTVNDQSLTKLTKGPLEAYNNLVALLETDVTEAFVNRFKSLFQKVIPLECECFKGE